jgi:glyoxylase-like metal-dependent hydrolase (beta-lactamase superfamily II)
VRACYPQATIYASRRALPLIENPTKIGVQLYRRLMWGMPSPVDGVRSLDDVDDVLQTPHFRFRAVETPGHSRDHISLFEPSHRWIFCGDAFVAGQERSWAREFDLFSVLSSLRTLASLRPERLFSGSGHVSRTPLPEIYDKIGSLMRLAREVARLDAAGMASSEMVASIFNGESPLRFWTVGHFSAANLIEACRSYNALFSAGTPMANTQSSLQTFDLETSDPGDASTSKPADKSDFVR